MTRIPTIAAGAVLFAAVAGVAIPETRQVVTGPVATYWVSAQTTSGVGAGLTGGGRPSMSQILSMARGGGGPQHSLQLQLGSSQAPSGSPQAEHDPPPGLGVGPSLPLVTPPPPTASAPGPVEESNPIPRQYQKPKGRMLIFWGCGAHARPGQPVVIDFSKVAEGHVPPGFEALSHGLGVSPETPPSVSRSRTYGEWPNSESRVSVPGNGSLVGPHTIRGDYSPQIDFALAPDQDFLGPMQLTTNVVGPAGEGQLAWAPVANARGYLAVAMGASQDTVVIWSSSETGAAGFALPGYLSRGDISRLLQSGALMGSQTTSCAMPAEAVQAAPHALLQLAAYRDEANFDYPARPTDPRRPWNILWTVKVRYRSSTTGLLGMNTAGPSSDAGKQQRPGVGDILHGLGAHLPF